jgi:hypothetical protein
MKQDDRTAQSDDQSAYPQGNWFQLQDVLFDHFEGLTDFGWVADLDHPDSRRAIE